MVEVEVSQEEVDPPRAAADEVETELADARAGVQHECRSVLQHHLDARGIATVGNRLRSGRRNRAATPPDLQAQRHPA
jgi:hypothetical protein